MGGRAGGAGSARFLNFLTEALFHLRRKAAEGEMRLTVWIGFALAVMQTSPTLATDADALLGSWQQVATSAGACPTCRLEFREGEQGLSVIANNGWTAILEGSRGGTFSGTGRWRSGGRTWIAGRPFTIGFDLDGDRLTMTMKVDMGKEPKPVVRAVYKRAWQGV
jgi:hypothetical protein